MDSQKVRTFIFLDLETTGLAGQRPKITEISMVAVHRTALLEPAVNNTPRVLDKLTLCVYPMKTVTSGAATITGLCNDSLYLQKDFDEDLANLLCLFICRLDSPACLVSHNGRKFDFGILKSELVRVQRELPAGLLCVDSWEMIRELEPKSAAGLHRQQNESTTPGGDGMSSRHAGVQPSHIPPLVPLSAREGAKATCFGQGDDEKTMLDEQRGAETPFKCPTDVKGKGRMLSFASPVRSNPNSCLQQEHTGLSLENVKRKLFHDAEKETESAKKLAMQLPEAVDVSSVTIACNPGLGADARSGQTACHIALSASANSLVNDCKPDESRGDEERHRKPSPVGIHQIDDAPVNQSTSKEVSMHPATADSVSSSNHDNASPEAGDSASTLEYWEEPQEEGRENGDDVATPMTVPPAELKKEVSNYWKMHAGDSLEDEMLACMEILTPDDAGSANKNQVGDSGDKTLRSSTATGVSSNTVITRPTHTAIEHDPKRGHPLKQTMRSYKLEDVHKGIVGYYPQETHSAEADCLSLLRIYNKRATEFISWADEHADYFQSIPCQYKPAVRAALARGTFPYQK